MFHRIAFSSLRRSAAPWLLLVPVSLLLGCPPAADVDEDGFSPDDADASLVDCNDNDPSINPGAADVCDGVDNDCDGSVDEGLDADGDGFFEHDEALCPSGNDCDDEDASVNPNADEECDAIDHDCDGEPTNGLTESAYYPDGDGDGFGAGDAEPNCDDTPPEGYTDNDEDCADNDALVNPDATEICNAVDDDCDEETDEGFDEDEDGFTTCGADGQVGTGEDDDCDDEDEDVNPDAEEACNGEDDDCDGLVPDDETDDGDTDGAVVCEDCNDAEAASFPGNAEICDGLDNDCEGTADFETTDDDGGGEVDTDGDLVLDCADCDDADDANFPGNTEVCDGQDNDCLDGTPADEIDDLDSDGAVACDDCDDNDADRYPANPEVCDGVDNDCDSATEFQTTDDDLGGEADSDLDGVLDCADCDDADADNFPGNPEVCDGADNDCDGVVEVGTADDDLDGVSICDGDCDDTDAANFPGNTEVCDAADNDCDAATFAAGEDPSADDGDSDGTVACLDCDDTNAAVNPDAAEVCDGLDTDCVGGPAVDEVDGDTDGYLECAGYVDNGGGFDGGDDCADGDTAINPGATETCDAVDQNCDDVIDDGFDADADGVTTCGADGIAATLDDDCDDAAPTVNPDADEICDLIDNDCDFDIDGNDSDYVGDDLDGDGYGSALCGGLDCDDDDPALVPRDDDGDGTTPCSGDCDETNPYIRPGAGEACDGIDTDCDGLVDDADGDLLSDWDGDGYDAIGCGIGGDDCDDHDPHVFPEDIYTSGVVPQCAPVVYPGFTYADQTVDSPQEATWNAARISLPDYFVDPQNPDNHYIYFRAHHDQEAQVIGVVESLDGGDTWGDPVGPLLSANAGEWDHRNVSQPTVAFLSQGTWDRPYVMAYHGRAEVGGTRLIGIATATDPLGPFERLDPADDSVAITAPTLPAAAAGLDNDRTLHPHLYYDDTSGLLHLWYSGRSTTDPGPRPLRIFHATSTDGGMTWARTDDDFNGESDVVMDASDSAWLTALGANQISQVNVIEDPTGTTDFEFWFTGGSAGIGLGVGAGTGSFTDWNSPASLPALESALDCRRFDGEVITGRGIRYDAAEDAYHWYYGGQTDLDTANCAGSEDLVYENGGDTASYIAYGINEAPFPEIDAIAAPATSMTLTGQITDTAPDQVVVTVSSDLDGFLLTAAVDAVGAPGPGVLTTTWSAAVTMSVGAHTLTVEAVDEAGTARTLSVPVTIP